MEGWLHRRRGQRASADRHTNCSAATAHANGARAPDHKDARTLLSAIHLMPPRAYLMPPRAEGTVNVFSMFFTAGSGTSAIHAYVPGARLTV